MPNPNWKPGMKAPSQGRPVGSTQKIKNSKLRKTLTKLREIEDKAIENIKNSVNGIEVDKEVLQNSRWVVTTICTVQKACVAEEQFKNQTNEDDEDNAPSVEPVKPRFTLDIVN